MLRSVPLALLVAVAAAASAQAPQTVLYPGLTGQPLLDAVRAGYRPPATLGYDVARDSLFAWEQRRYGRLTCVYTGFAVVLPPGADPSTAAFERGVNTEHTWPQSMGASAEPSRSDLHHLYPTRDNVNSSRGNVPYGEIPDAQTDTWFRLDQSQPTVPTVAIDEWSEKDNAASGGFAGRFEPREAHAGDAARAVFYYVAVYPERVQTAGAQPFFDVQRADLLRWARQDPVDTREAARSSWIASKQGTENPFVLDSTLARRAFTPGTSSAEPAPATFAVRVVGPNPFASGTRVAVGAEPGAVVRAALVDVLGREVAVVHDGPLAGEIAVEGSGLVPGLYVVVVRTPGGVAAVPLVRR